MNILLDPNVAYLLLVSGMILAILALFTPGTGVLELGAVFLLMLAGYAIYNLPANAWALIVLLLGVFPFLLALRRWRWWPLLIISLIALVTGSAFMFRTSAGGPAVHPVLAFIVSLLAVSFLWVVGRKGLEAVEQPTASLDDLLGMLGKARTPVLTEGAVYVGGEEWTARSQKPIPAGASVRVVGREGLVLMVEQVTPPQPA